MYFVQNKERKILLLLLSILQTVRSNCEHYLAIEHSSYIYNYNYNYSYNCLLIFQKDSFFSFSKHFSGVSTKCGQNKFKRRQDPETAWNIKTWYEFESCNSDKDKKMVTDDAITFPKYHICILQTRNYFC